MISYAQNFEDVMLRRALRAIDHGFYLDIGAQDPVIDSVSLGFYELGWRGVHVEPTPAYANALRDARPDETVVQVAIGTEPALMPFFEIPGTGISTGDAQIAQLHQAAGYAPRRIEVPCITLSALFDTLPTRDIHWMKIDVEGMEGQVIRSWAPSPVRPWVVVVESTRPRTSEPSFTDWDPLVQNLGYHFAYSDGLNRYYVSEHHRELVPAFSTPPNVFDDFSLSGTASNGFAAHLNRVIEKDRARITEVSTRVAELTSGYLELENQLAAEKGWRQKFVELDATLQEYQRKADRRIDEALAHARQLAEGLQKMTAARDEALVLLQQSRERETQRSGELEQVRQEAAAMEQKLDHVFSELHATRATRDELAHLQEEARGKFQLRGVFSKTALKGLIDRTRKNGHQPELPSAIAAAPITITMNATSPTPPAASVSQLLTHFDVTFVQNAYRALLGREADPSGLETYVTKLRQGHSRESIVVEIARSEEARQYNRDIPGLAELLEHEEASRPNLARRMQQRLAGDSVESLAKLVRSAENRSAALAAELDARIAGVETALRQVAESEKASHLWRSMLQTEALDGLKLMTRTSDAQRALQDRLFHRLKQAAHR